MPPGGTGPYRAGRDAFHRVRDLHNGFDGVSPYRRWTPTTSRKFPVTFFVFCFWK
jgi:hypothetical protein